MKTTVYFISDLHFGHKNILKFSHEREGNTVEEHDECLLDLINTTCKKKTDHLYVLGDVAFSPEGLRRCRDIRCETRLILGNHDLYTIDDYWYNFDKILPSVFKYKEFWLSHAPIHPLELRGKHNIHGHVHNATIPDYKYINVCVEPLKGIPISLGEIRDRIK